MTRNLSCLIVVCLLLTGCWDQRELSTVSIITGMAIDKAKSGKFKLTVLGINAAELSEQTAQGNSPTAMHSMEGDTVAELSQKMNTAFSKNLVYSHMKVVVISEKIANEGMLDFLDYLERNREIRDNISVVLAKGGEAKDILKVTSIIQKDPALKLDTQLKEALKYWGLSPDVKLNNLIEALTSPGRQPVLVTLKIKGDPKKGETVDNLKKAEPDAVVLIDSLALFQDEKLKGFLSLVDSRNYLWTQNEIINTTVSVPCGKDKFAAIKVVDSVTRVKGKIQNGQPKITVDISAQSFFNGGNCEYPMDKPDSYKKLEKMTEQYIQESINKTIKTVQKDYGVDIFGFGEVVYRQDYQQFKKVKSHWDEAFQAADINIIADVKISNAGIRTKGIFERKK